MFLLLLQAFLCVVAADVAYFYQSTNNGVYNLNASPNQFDSNSCFKFIIHGYTEDANRTHYILMADTYLSTNTSCNIVRVDYSAYENGSTSYPFWVNSVPSVGSYIGDYLINMMQTYQVKPENIHLVAHSLGGQVAGYVGRRVIAITGNKLGRISGLDPAAPLFETQISSKKLTANDAQFVDIIHTDGGVLGVLGPYGTVDFYPNGGTRYQPGCNATVDLTSFSQLESSTINYCSHHKSHLFFTESIVNDYYGTKCDSWLSFKIGLCANHNKILFGEKTPRDASGIYYLKMV